MSIIERRRMLAIGLYSAMTIITLSAGTQPATTQALIGAAAPAFTLTDSNGRNLSLSDFKGKTVVLEWTSHECPYVGKHYRGNNMQALQKKWTGQGVVWLSVLSSAPGQPGYVSPQQANKLTADRGAAPTAVLLDPTGKVGHAYGARTTPHMYVINGEGALVYKGGIDDQPTAGPGPEERPEFCRPGAERDLAGQAGVRHRLARLRLLDQIWVVKRRPAPARPWSHRRRELVDREE